MLARLAILLFLAVTPLSGQSSVWKVTRGDRTLYLGGTLHMLRPQDFPLPAEFDEAFAASRTIVFETDVARLRSPELQRVVATRGLFAGDTTLDRVLTPAAWKAVQRYAAHAGLPLETVREMKPWLFTITIATLELQKLGISSEGVDLHYFSRAQAEGKSTGELESFDRHIDHLVTMGAGHESEMIEKSIADLASMRRLLPDVISAWRAGNLERIDALMLRDFRKDYPAVYRSLLTARNADWLTRLESLLATPETEFVLVGAGHLPARDGLIALLTRMGCRVEQLKVTPARVPR
jgi:uncharacterized protein YbaP (TraB family)